VSILSCDNLPENGAVTMAVVTDLAGAIDDGADRARTAAEADDEPTAVAGVLETLHSGLGQDSALVRVIIEQMEALTDQR
jgi:mannitol-1-phosphate/altronate dehydrogenase